MPLTEARLTEANLAKLPKALRVEALMQLAKNKLGDCDISDVASHRPDTAGAPSVASAGVYRPATNVFHVYHEKNEGDRPSTAGGMSVAPSIAGSLGGRIKQSLRQHAAVNVRPPTAQSQRSIASSRPPSAAQPKVAAARPRPPTPEPVYDPVKLMMEECPDLVEGFRREFRAKQAAKREAEAAAAAKSAAAHEAAEARAAAAAVEVEPVAYAPSASGASEADMPLGEIPVNTRPSTAASRPLTGHSQISLSSSKATQPEVRPWSKKGRKVVSHARAAQSTVGLCFEWE